MRSRRRRFARARHRTRRLLANLPTGPYCTYNAIVDDPLKEPVTIESVLAAVRSLLDVERRRFTFELPTLPVGPTPAELLDEWAAQWPPSFAGHAMWLPIQPILEVPDR